MFDLTKDRQKSAIKERRNVPVHNNDRKIGLPRLSRSRATHSVQKVRAGHCQHGTACWNPPEGVLDSNLPVGVGDWWSFVRVVRNIGYVRKRRRVARIMVVVGLLLILTAIAFTLSPGLLFFAYAGLIIGFLTFNGGMQQVGRWSRKPRNDEVLDAALSRLNDRYALIHYAEFPGRRPDHILITPAGIMVLSTREIAGRVSVNGRRWRKRGSPFGFIFGMSGPQLGNPTIENEEQIATLTTFLTEENIQAHVEGAVVFLHPNVEVEVQDETVPVVHVTELYDYVRDRSDVVSLGNRERDALIEKLSRGEELERVGSSPATPKKKLRAT